MDLIIALSRKSVRGLRFVFPRWVTFLSGELRLMGLGCCVERDMGLVSWMSGLRSMSDRGRVRAFAVADSSYSVA